MSALPKFDADDLGARITSSLISSHRLALPANANACCFSRDGRHAAFALGDGSLAVATRQSLASEAPIIDVRPRHRVAAVAVAAVASGFVTAGQDGAVMLTDPGVVDEPRELWRSDGEWVETLVVDASGQRIALAAGADVIVLDASGGSVARTKLSSSVMGLAFDAAGQRLAAAHYGGLSLIDIASSTTSTTLAWKGAHIGVAWSPCGRYVVSALQEKELHGWDLVTMQDFRMGGYPRKTQAMAWTADGTMLACSGADVVTAWSFAGSGPAGRPPIEIGFVFGATVTTVAAHPMRNLVAGGFSSGDVLIGATGKGEALVAQARSGTPITALAWSPDGQMLLAADRAGNATAFVVPDDLPVR